MAKSDSKTVNPEKSSQASDKKVDEGKLKALGLAMDQITKQFGDGSIMKLGEAHKVDVEVIPSGALSLDLALGGGYPKGRIIEIYGPESSGKTTLTLHAIAALTPQAEIDGDMGDSHMGLQARLMSQALRKLTGIINKSKATVIFINQIRMKIGVMFGNPETTTGGNALKFYASQRIDIRRIGQIKVGDDIIGNRTKIKVVKNKIAPPFRVAEFDIMYNEGISKTGDILDLAATHGIVEKSGAFYKYNGETIGQGRDKTKNYLKENPEVLAEIDQKVRDKVKEAES